MNPADAFISLTNNMKERAFNPLFGSFFSAWIVCNWKLLLYLFFAEVKIEDKIINIESSMLGVQNLLIYPLMFSIAYIFIFQWVNILITRWFLYIEKLKLNALTEGEINRRNLIHIRTLSDPKMANEYFELERIISRLVVNASDSDRSKLITALKDITTDSNSQR